MASFRSTGVFTEHRNLSLRYHDKDVGRDTGTDVGRAFRQLSPIQKPAIAKINPNGGKNTVNTSA